MEYKLKKKFCYFVLTEINSWYLVRQEDERRWSATNIDLKIEDPKRISFIGNSVKTLEFLNELKILDFINLESASTTHIRKFMMMLLLNLDFKRAILESFDNKEDKLTITFKK